MEQEARREGRLQAAEENPDADDSSSEQSSDWDDWQDQDYIEE